MVGAQTTTQEDEEDVLLLVMTDLFNHSLTIKCHRVNRLVPHADSYLLQHGKFIARSADKTITFWDTVTHLSHPTHPQIACSSDDQLVAFAAKRKITLKVSSVLFPKSLPSRYVLCPVFNPSLLHLSHSTSQTFISTALHSMHVNMTDFRMQKHYFPRQS